MARRKDREESGLLRPDKSGLAKTDGSGDCEAFSEPQARKLVSRNDTQRVIANGFPSLSF